MPDIEPILLGVIAFQENNKTYMVCLDTNIIIRADNLETAKIKMKDALTSYFNTFEEREVLEGKHIRKASKKYLIYWYLFHILKRLLKKSIQPAM